MSELTPAAKDTLKWLGCFGPTVRGDSFKGWMLDEEGDAEKIYVNEGILRNIAKGCIEAAEWMVKNTKGGTK